MAKVVLLALLALLALRLVTGRWLWPRRVNGPGRPRCSADEAALAAARRTLGVGPRASRAQIVDAHRRLVTSVHPDRGGEGPRASAANAARDLLLARPDEHS
ncbi:molecular chaperone DnaJ [Erythrobacteraceae bacterium CFH 75059]|uniref:molecular chaperone DnaJ n=1 Tax=Qipengyuania thermophila TaxID=2509361 RepID=UPI0010202EEB|nr:molecular chaperone DnaJ [Qipengyuania thermophila]TCD06806.1 molecular chaperone DnaJ [Erythrobacteraceae bacterium CFH 75059]